MSPRRRLGDLGNAAPAIDLRTLDDADDYGNEALLQQAPSAHDLARIGAQWAEVDHAYRQHLTARRYAPGTIRKYAQWVPRLRRYSLNEGRCIAPWEMSTEDLAAFLGAHEWSGLSANEALKGLVYLYEWAEDRRFLAVSPAAALPRRTLERRPIAMQWAEAWGDFFQHLQASGIRKSTIDARRAYVRRFSEHCGPVGPFEVRTEDLEEFLAAQEWAPETRRMAQSSLRRFYDWAEQAGHVYANPARYLRPVRVPQATPRPAPERTIETALAVAERREVVMLLLAAYAGLRAGEVASLHTGDVLLEEEWVEGPDGAQTCRLVGRLYVTGKGGRQREIPLQPDGPLARALKEWIGVRRNAVFPGQIDGHLSSMYVSKLLGRVLGNGVRAHQLRHRFASAGYAGTRDLRAMQTLLGHSKPETTARYTAVADGSLMDAVVAAGRRPLGRS